MFYSLIRSGDSVGWIFEIACCEFYNHVVKVFETTAHVFKRLFADVGMSGALVLEARCVENRNKTRMATRRISAIENGRSKYPKRLMVRISCFNAQLLQPYG